MASQEMDYMFEHTWHVLINVTIRWECKYRNEHKFRAPTSLHWQSYSEIFSMIWHTVAHQMMLMVNVALSTVVKKL
jgi:hypothetical protein